MRLIIVKVIINLTTKPLLNVPSNIIVLLRSIMEPNTKKDNMELEVNVVRKGLTTNASASDHKDKLKVKSIIKGMDKIVSCPTLMRLDLGIKILILEAIMAPIIRNLPISKNSFSI